jgi:hypothetical protein
MTQACICFSRLLIFVHDRRFGSDRRTQKRRRHAFRYRIRNRKGIRMRMRMRIRIRNRIGGRFSTFTESIIKQARYMVNDMYLLYLFVAHEYCLLFFLFFSVRSTMSWRVSG